MRNTAGSIDLHAHGAAMLRMPRVRTPRTSDAVVGTSAGMRAAFTVARRVARSNAGVLIEGESGTGKEMLARTIHEHSERAAERFVAVNCAAITDSLVESELFGHERGAFTGAVARRVGRFERASYGTLFLDEVGDMSPAMQAKILRVLQEQEFERVGGTSSVRVDVRMIAATNHDLAAEVAAGRFREDLYYRLAVVVVRLPTLRERGSDVELLARHFAAQFASELRRPVPRIAEPTLHLLQAYPWPGNVRQLRNAMERALVVLDGDCLLPEHLPPEVRTAADPPPDAAADAVPGAGTPMPFPSLREVEERHIRRALAMTDGNRGHAAEILGIHRNTLRKKLRRLRLEG
jgi:DNA-binding NtrC family response regulator